MRYCIFSALTLLTVAASGSINSVAVGQPLSPYVNSGIQGQVRIGSRCPVLREGMDCSPRPYQATILVLNSKGKEVTRFQTDDKGRFQVTLAPGRYTLHPESPERYPFAREQTITVTGKNFTTVEITYNTGIR